MGSKSSVDAAVKTDKPHYYPGQTVKTSIYVNAPKPHLCSKVVLHIEGYEQSQFRLNVGNNPVKNSQNILIRTFFVLKDFRSSKSYLQGQYEFPCEYTLPWTIPGSFKEQKGGYKAKIVYLMKVILVCPKDSRSNFQKIHQIVVRQPAKQFDHYQMGTISIQPKCLCFRNLGVSHVKCWFQKKNYLPNEDCVMICEVDNMKSQRDITSVKCQFIKKITLRTSLGGTQQFKQIINTVEFRGVNKGSAYIGPLAERAMLPLKFKNTNNGIPPSTTGNLVKCQYLINVTPKIGGCFTKGQKTFYVNLQILHPQIIQKLQKPDEWKPQVSSIYQIQMIGKDENQMRQSLIGQFAAE